MKKIIFTWKVISRIKTYADNYVDFYIDLYKDSWIWWLEEILKNYRREWRIRYKSIVKTIKTKLQEDIISYPNNRVIITWKTKILIIKFKDEENLRIIEDLDIR